MPAKNVFAELGLENDEATAEAWRSDFARIIREYFQRSQVSQVAFAKQLGVKQSVVSRIINTRLQGLSIEFLLKLCVKLETRGAATWGPSPDEARVTTEVASVMGTALSREDAHLNLSEEVINVQPVVGSRNTGSDIVKPN
jgi:predicted XRE-type DNA-binding protein